MTAEEFRKLCQNAEGYIELGMLEDAANILEDMPTRLKITKEVIVLHMSILVKSGQTLKASYLAENLSFGEPENVGLMLEAAQLKYDAGEFTEALKWLQSVEAACRMSAGFHLIRAYCHSALGDIEACALALRQVHAIEPELKLKNLDDPRFDAIYGKESSSP